MKILETYIGIEPFTVKVDDSAQLRDLTARARGFRDLPFEEKLREVKRLANDAMVNASEQMVVWGRKENELKLITSLPTQREQHARELREVSALHAKYQGIVMTSHPLSHALEQQAGCCRYQGALFFVLGYEAGLGDRHFIQAVPVNERVNSVFNQVYDGETMHTVSIFLESLVDKGLDYSRPNPKVFEQAFRNLQGYNFYSYHRGSNGLVLVENPDKHIEHIEKIWA